MIELWAVLAPILLADIVNPVLFAFLVYAAGTSRPVANSSALLLGHTAAYFIAGMLLALGLEKIDNRLANPEPVDFIVELFIGLVLLWLVMRSRNTKAKQPEVATKDMTFISAFFLGAIVNFVGIPFAIPYFAALSQILKADIPATQALAVLAAYNIAYALPFASVPLLSMLMGDNSKSLLETINAFLTKASSVIMPVILLLLGAALITDAVYYFVKGKALF